MQPSNLALEGRHFLLEGHCGYSGHLWLGKGEELLTQAVHGVWGGIFDKMGEAGRVNCGTKLLLQIVPLCIGGGCLVPVWPRVSPAQEVRKLFERVFWATCDDVRDAGAQLISPGTTRHVLGCCAVLGTRAVRAQRLLRPPPRRRAVRPSAT